MKTRTAFTLIEILVVIAIISVLMALLLPAIGVVREAARRTQCKNSLCQLAVALHNYHMAFNVLPPGCVNETGPIVNSESGYHMSWLVQSLPTMDRTRVFDQIDFSRGVYDPANAIVRSQSLPGLICPSTGNPPVPTNSPAVSSYVGCTGGIDEPIGENNTGLFFLNSSISYKQIRDGTSYTIMLSERDVNEVTNRPDLGWMSGTSATLRHSVFPTIATTTLGNSVTDQPEQSIDYPSEQLTGGFSSPHSQINVAYADGSVAVLNGAGQLGRQLGCRSDGELMIEF